MNNQHKNNEVVQQSFINTESDLPTVDVNVHISRGGYPSSSTRGYVQYPAPSQAMVYNSRPVYVPQQQYSNGPYYIAQYGQQQGIVIPQNSVLLQQNDSNSLQNAGLLQQNVRSVEPNSIIQQNTHNSMAYTPSNSTTYQQNVRNVEPNSVLQQNRPSMSSTLQQNSRNIEPNSVLQQNRPSMSSTFQQNRPSMSSTFQQNGRNVEPNSVLQQNRPSMSSTFQQNGRNVEPNSVLQQNRPSMSSTFQQNDRTAVRNNTALQQLHHIVYSKNIPSGSSVQIDNGSNASHSYIPNIQQNVTLPSTSAPGYYKVTKNYIGDPPSYQPQEVHPPQQPSQTVAAKPLKPKQVKTSLAQKKWLQPPTFPEQQFFLAQRRYAGEVSVRVGVKLSLKIPSGSQQWSKDISAGVEEAVNAGYLLDWFYVKSVIYNVPVDCVVKNVEMFCFYEPKSLAHLISTRLVFPLPFCVTKAGVPCKHFFLAMSDNFEHDLKECKGNLDADSSMTALQEMIKTNLIEAPNDFKQIVLKLVRVKKKPENWSADFHRLITDNHLQNGFLQTWVRYVYKKLGGQIPITRIATHLQLRTLVVGLSVLTNADYYYLVTEKNNITYYLTFDPSKEVFKDSEFESLVFDNINFSYKFAVPTEHYISSYLLFLKGEVNKNDPPKTQEGTNSEPKRPQLKIRPVEEINASVMSKNEIPPSMINNMKNITSLTSTSMMEPSNRNLLTRPAAAEQVTATELNIVESEVHLYPEDEAYAGAALETLLKLKKNDNICDSELYQGDDRFQSLTLRKAIYEVMQGSPPSFMDFMFGVYHKLRILFNPDVTQNIMKRYVHYIFYVTMNEERFKQDRHAQYKIEPHIETYFKNKLEQFFKNKEKNKNNLSSNNDAQLNKIVIYSQALKKARTKSPSTFIELLDYIYDELIEYFSYDVVHEIMTKRIAEIYRLTRYTSALKKERDEELAKDESINSQVLHFVNGRLDELFQNHAHDFETNTIRNPPTNEEDKANHFLSAITEAHKASPDSFVNLLEQVYVHLRCYYDPFSVKEIMSKRIVEDTLRRSKKQTPSKEMVVESVDISEEETQPTRQKVEPPSDLNKKKRFLLPVVLVNREEVDKYLEMAAKKQRSIENCSSSESQPVKPSVKNKVQYIDSESSDEDKEISSFLKKSSDGNLQDNNCKKLKMDEEPSTSTSQMGFAFVPVKDGSDEFVHESTSPVYDEKHSTDEANKFMHMESDTDPDDPPPDQVSESEASESKNDSTAIAEENSQEVIDLNSDSSDSDKRKKTNKPKCKTKKKRDSSDSSESRKASLRSKQPKYYADSSDSEYDNVAKQWKSKNKNKKKERNSDSSGTRRSKKTKYVVNSSDSDKEMNPKLSHKITKLSTSSDSDSNVVEFDKSNLNKNKNSEENKERRNSVIHSSDKITVTSKPQSTSLGASTSKETAPSNPDKSIERTDSSDFDIIELSSDENTESNTTTKQASGSNNSDVKEIVCDEPSTSNITSSKDGFTCKVKFCKKNFDNFASYCEHMSNPSSHVLNVRCPACELRFLDKDQLSLHFLEKHKNIVNINCKFCSKTFLNDVFLQIHLKNFHPTELCCDLCRTSFDSQILFEQHLESSKHKQLILNKSLNGS